jgi:TP901 family phage tail tape measure protein
MAGLAGEVANLIVALKLDDSGFTGKLNAAARSLKGMDKGLSTIGRGSGQIARGVGQIADRVVIAGAGLATFAITTAASFEQAEASIRKTVDGTTKEVDTLVGQVRQMARDVPLSFEELAAIAAEGGALGITTKGLDEFTEVVARLGVSTDLTTDQAASALGQLSNVLGLSEDELQDFADSLVALGNDGASTESQILDMTARFGAAGRQAGLSNEAILALASTTASMGIEAEAGGGALSRVFNGITVDIANANDESKALAEAMGLSLEDLRKAWDQDAGAVFGDLLAHIKELDQFEAAQFLGDLGITNTRDINAITLLAEGVDEYQRQLGVAEGQTNELNRESDVFFNTTQGRWKRLQNNVKDAAAIIGNEMLPVVNELADEFMAWLNEPGTQRGLKDFAENLADGVRGLVKELKGADFGPIIETMKGAAGVAKTAFDAFNALPGPVKQLAIAALVANKVTGGAVGSIAAGLGNVLKGTIQLAFERGSPTNPMFVVPVGGGLGGPGVPGGGGGGLLGGLKTGVALAAPVLAGVAAVEVINFQNMRNEATSHLESILDDLPRRTADDINESISRVEDQINQDRPFLEGILFNTNVKPVLEKELDALRREQVQAAIDITRGTTSVEQAIKTEAARAAGSDRAMLNSAITREGIAFRQERLAAAAVSHDQNLVQLARNATDYNRRTASATEATSRKRFSFDPKITTNVTVPITNVVNSTVIQTQLHQLRTTTGSGGFI